MPPPLRFGDGLLPGFALVVSDRAVALVRHGYEAHAALLGLDGAPSSDEHVRGGREAHPLVALPRRERAVVRRYRRGGLVRHLVSDRYFLGHRSLEELRAAEAARAGGVRTPPVLAATEIPALVGYRAFLATRWVRDARESAGWMTDAGEEERRAMLREAGRQVGTTHAAGVAHPDLNLRNLLVRPAKGGPEVWIIDFDRAVVSNQPVANGRRESDLRRLARSARKLGAPIDASGWEAFREGYGAGWPPGLVLG